MIDILLDAIFFDRGLYCLCFLRVSLKIHSKFVKLWETKNLQWNCDTRWNCESWEDCICHIHHKLTPMYVTTLAAVMCVCVCMCVFISIYCKGFSWLNRMMDVLPDIQASDVVLRKLLCVKNLRLHVIVNHSRDLLASNCARVSVKPGRATRSKRQLLKLSKN